MDGRVKGRETRTSGLRRLQRRRRELTCRRTLPAARILLDTNASFLALRRAFAEPSGDVCPHRGYDLRSVPVDEEGYRPSAGAAAELAAFDAAIEPALRGAMEPDAERNEQ